MTVHINPENGDLGTCRAEIKCPFQEKGEALGVVTHFNSMKEAKTASAVLCEKLYGEDYWSIDKTDKIDNDKKQNDNVSRPKIISNLDDVKTLLGNEEELSSAEIKELMKYISKHPEEYFYTVPGLLHRAEIDNDTAKKLVKIHGAKNLLRDTQLAEEAYKVIASSRLTTKQVEDFLENNEQIPKSALEILSNKLSDSNNHYVIAHPNCDGELSTKILTRAVQNSPDALNNIYFDLKRYDKLNGKIIELFLKNKVRFYYDLKELANHPECPEDIKKEYDKFVKLAALTKDKKISAAELDNLLNAKYLKKELPIATTNKWKPLYSMRREALSHGNLGDDTIKRLVMEDGDNDDLWALANSQRIKSSKVFNEIYQDVLTNPKYAESEKTSVLRILAKSECATSEQLSQIANLCEDYRSYRFREWALGSIARHKNTPPQLLKKLATHRLEDVKRAAADNPHTPTASLDRLATLKQGNIINALLKNPNLSATGQMNLIKNPIMDEDGIKNLLKENSNLDPAVLDKLADYGDKEIVELVKQHPKTSMKTLLRLGEQNSEE